MSFFRFRGYFGNFLGLMGILVFLVVFWHFRVWWFLEMILSIRLDTAETACVFIFFFFFFFFFFFWDALFCGSNGFPVGSMYYSRDPQASFFSQTFIKNGSHDTIQSFKNYFSVVFSVFNFQFLAKQAISKHTFSS